MKFFSRSKAYGIIGLKNDKDFESYYSSRLLNEHDFLKILTEANEANEEIILNELSEHFKQAVKKWAQYMMKKTKNSHEKHYKKLSKFQLVVNISNFDIDEMNNVLNGRINIILNKRVEGSEQSYEFFKAFHANLDDIFGQAARKKWIESNSKWFQLLGL